MVFGGHDFGMWLDHDSRALMNGISALLKKTQRAPLSLFPCEEPAKKMVFSEPGSSPLPDTKSASALILDSQAPRTKFLCLEAT